MAAPLFEINCVYRPSSRLPEFSQDVRLVGHDRNRVLLMPLSASLSKAGMVRIDYDRWADLISEGHIEPIEDPYSWLPSEAPRSLPSGAVLRLRMFRSVLHALSLDEKVIYRPHALSEFFDNQVEWINEALARNVLGNSPEKPKKIAKDTLKRWFYAWLRAGRKELSIVESVIREKPVAAQVAGKKRGRINPILPKESTIPGYTAAAVFKQAYDTYIVKEQLTIDESYTRTLRNLLKIPEADLENIWTDPSIAKKYTLISIDQYRRAMAKLIRKNAAPPSDVPLGKRARATDGVFGPGYFEIDATHFQIQLVSRLGGRQLISRPTVYFVVDIYSGVIVGYVLTLENCSWAIAMLALHNAFSDKQRTFTRLGLDLTDEDWPCHHLPVMLRADRAEFLTNKGQKFPESLIRVEITPPYQAKAKGTVEGKNSEAKRKTRALPGTYKKRLERGDSDGKKDAALDLNQFERILVKFIIELNDRPINRRRIPISSISAGDIVGSRLDLWKWGLRNRAGYTVKPNKNFVYEHLMSHSYATLTSRGIVFENQTYHSALLLELGWLQSCPTSGRPIEIAYNLLFAGEINFFNSKDDSWHTAHNLDTDVISSKASFAELRELSTTKDAILGQAKVRAHLKKEDNQPSIAREIADAREETKLARSLSPSKKMGIRESRQLEKVLTREPGFNAGLDTKSRDAIQPPSDKSSLDKKDAQGPKRRKALDYWEE